ncbi:MAG TPA: rhodanese-like domain-containing protein [Candidatus Acidoferrales bacterium]|nr:rhodanese-like domain-containing protein [Candidatus Acidoferrales bacterium]
MSDIQIAPSELKQKIDAGEKPLIVDVREPWEAEICTISGSKLVPLSTVASNLSAFEGAGEVILYCHHGMRSLNAAAFLRRQGVEGARSLTGGIERWASEIDPGMARY